MASTSAIWAAQEHQITSPEGTSKLTFSVGDDGVPRYAVNFGEEVIIKPSKLGLEFKDQDNLTGPFTISAHKETTLDDKWKPVWGQKSEIHNHATQLKVRLTETGGKKRHLDLTFRAYDDGIGFRYEIPEQPNLTTFNLTNELTTFEFAGDHTTWWVEDLPDTYERDYNVSPLTRAANEGASTPVTMRTSTGTHISLHEADLTDWAGMKLKRGNGGAQLSFEAELVPWFESDIKVKGKAPHNSPWRSIQLGKNAGELITSSLILNLNDPCEIEDTSWIKPAKFMGIWWGCITGTWNWELEKNPDMHGATTERAKRYIDACARHKIPCLLIEGWNEGWEGDIPGWGDMNMTKTYPDFDIEAVTRYGKMKGVSLVGHHETGGNIANYEKQLPEAFKYYQKYGIDRIKTGYVSGDIPVYTEGLTDPGREHHHGQFMVNHHQRVIEMAAKYKIMIDAHEPIKATGISRTWPNFVAREGARGGEFNHFIGNPPSQTCILPFTRLLGGPMDYTPGIFDSAYTPDKRFGTRSQQLGLFVCFWSPLQMAADFYQAYDGEPATQFIRNVPVGQWDETIIPDARIGEYLVTARRQGEEWFIGGINNEEARELKLPLNFLESGKSYTAVIYQDGPEADYVKNPYPVAISEVEVTSETVMDLKFARGGGIAVEIHPKGKKFDRPSGEPGKIIANRAYNLRAKHSGRLLTVGNEAPYQKGDTRRADQKWRLQADENGLYRIISDGRAVTCSGRDNGSMVTMEQTNQSDTNQLWKLEHIVGTWFRLKHSESGKLLDVKDINYSDGGNLHLWEMAYSPNQIWSLELVENN